MNITDIIESTRNGYVKWISGTEVENFYNRFGYSPKYSYFTIVSDGSYAAVLLDDESSEPYVTFFIDGTFNATPESEDGSIANARELLKLIKESI